MAVLCTAALWSVAQVDYVYTRFWMQGHGMAWHGMIGKPACPVIGDLHGTLFQTQLGI